MKQLAVILLAAAVIACGVNAEEKKGVEDNISGTVENGLRYLELPESSEKLELTVYRGDYIIFNIPESSSATFSVPGLEIDETLPKPADEKPYVKIKKSGTYTFTLGDSEGTLKVLELEATNYEELTAAEANDLINSREILLLDVRTPAEYENVRIPGSSLLPVQVFSDNLDKLEPYKDEAILVYCQSGNRSTVASRILLQEGYSRVYNLRFGIGDWISKGFETE